MPACKLLPAPRICPHALAVVIILETSSDELALTFNHDIAEAADHVAAPDEFFMEIPAYYMLDEAFTVQ